MHFSNQLLRIIEKESEKKSFVLRYLGNSCKCSLRIFRMITSDGKQQRKRKTVTKIETNK